MSPAQKVEQVQDEHTLERNGRPGVVCSCGHIPQTTRRFVELDHRAHVAERIVAALGEPTVEYGVRWDDYPGVPVMHADRTQAKAIVGTVLVSRTVLTGEWQEVDRG